MTMPGTHRTPPDAEGDYVEVHERVGHGVIVRVHSPERDIEAPAHVSLDALPALVAALAAHLTVDDRRALTRDLAAQDGDVVVDRRDLSLVLTTAEEHGLVGHPNYRLRAAIEAARPVPHTREQDR